MYNMNQPNYQQPDNYFTNKRPTNGLGIASMILGILGLLLSFAFGIGGILAVVGLILAIVAMAKGARDGMTITGLILSIVSIVLSIIFFFVMVLSVNTYLNRAKKASSSVDLHNWSVSRVNEEIQRQL